MTELLDGSDLWPGVELGDGSSPPWIMEVRLIPTAGGPNPALRLDPHGCKCFCHFDWALARARHRFIVHHRARSKLRSATPPARSSRTIPRN